MRVRDDSPPIWQGLRARYSGYSKIIYRRPVHSVRSATNRKGSLYDELHKVACFSRRSLRPFRWHCSSHPCAAHDQRRPQPPPQVSCSHRPHLTRPSTPVRGRMLARAKAVATPSTPARTAAKGKAPALPTAPKLLRTRKSFAPSWRSECSLRPPLFSRFLQFNRF